MLWSNKAQFIKQCHLTVGQIAIYYESGIDIFIEGVILKLYTSNNTKTVKKKSHSSNNNGFFKNGSVIPTYHKLNYP